eukprot:TRINITY_DN39583_c0_g1_i1.p1 TRINITY_DN39583_c0_g1~~TRINITY_DN39583_c0_g1_i1.p1  ORF type:complete len:214 (+),score=21.63 TRINITY_DN39583_c0_g1_i1:301-942(+)
MEGPSTTTLVHAHTQGYPRFKVVGPLFFEQSLPDGSVNYKMFEADVNHGKSASTTRVPTQSHKWRINRTTANDFFEVLKFKVSDWHPTKWNCQSFVRGMLEVLADNNDMIKWYDSALTQDAKMLTTGVSETFVDFIGWANRQVAPTTPSLDGQVLSDAWKSLGIDPSHTIVRVEVYWQRADPKKKAVLVSDDNAIAEQTVREIALKEGPESGE